MHYRYTHIMRVSLVETVDEQDDDNNSNNHHNDNNKKLFKKRTDV